LAVKNKKSFESIVLKFPLDLSTDLNNIFFFFSADPIVEEMKFKNSLLKVQSDRTTKVFYFIFLSLHHYSSNLKKVHFFE
jgi:hypothetical protein